MQYTAEYCVEHPEDTGCALFVPVFQRETGELAVVELPGTQSDFK